MIKKGDISGKMAKEVFEEAYKIGKTPAEIVKAKGLTQISDETTLLEKIDTVLKANPKEVESYKAGKEKLIGFFVGQVMSATRGQANPEAVNRLLKEQLSK
jgi:aspartyl-tRNA(Asn)/glutamyl-tRNA(Gln) amidotransferase subunit B